MWYFSRNDEKQDHFKCRAYGSDECATDQAVETIGRHRRNKRICSSLLMIHKSLHCPPRQTPRYTDM